MSDNRIPADQRGKAIEDRNAQSQPAEDYLVRMGRAWEGPSNSGTANIHGADTKPKTRGQRLVAVIEGVADRHRKNTKLQDYTRLTPDQKKQRAKELREAADELERK